ncbi:hypothetical protein NKH16_11280 [Mesorhizobium sp. M1307]|uniref:hypothetical protein n=1 Tax=Mesorhizobium sp. M1307 TaxID=2957079 RepID=UPI003334A7F5
MPAKATAGVALLRANGMLAEKAGSKKTKDPSEMTGDELQTEIDRLKRAARVIEEPLSDAENDGDGAFD